MTGEIFSQVLDKWNTTLRLKSRKIILFVDNCSAHPAALSFSNILVQFLPANTTSITQPMDGGVIKCLKGFYRLGLARRLVLEMEANKSIRSNSLPIIQALEMICSCWETEVSSSLIQNLDTVAFLRLNVDKKSYFRNIIGNMRR